MPPLQLHGFSCFFFFLLFCCKFWFWKFWFCKFWFCKFCSLSLMFDVLNLPFLFRGGFESPHLHVGLKKRGMTDFFVVILPFAKPYSRNSQSVPNVLARHRSPHSSGLRGQNTRHQGTWFCQDCTQLVLQKLVVIWWSMSPCLVLSNTLKILLITPSATGFLLILLFFWHLRK